MKKDIRVLVTCRDSVGNAVFLPLIVPCTEEEYDLGEHYGFAKLYAEDKGYEPALCYDEAELPRNLLGSFEWVKIHPMPDTYKVTVVFTRSRLEDGEVARSNFPNLSSDEALIQQLCKELQGVYDEGGMSGTFEIEGFKEV